MTRFFKIQAWAEGGRVSPAPRLPDNLTGGRTTSPSNAHGDHLIEDRDQAIIRAAAGAERRAMGFTQHTTLGCHTCKRRFVGRGHKRGGSWDEAGGPAGC